MVFRVTRIDLPSGDWTSEKSPLNHPVHAKRASDKKGAANLQPCADLPCFVAGPENRLSVPILQKLLDGYAPDLTGPFVLTGPSGTGKSFLARGIVRRWSELLDNGKTGVGTVGYFTATDFSREVLAARNDNNLNDFRQQLLNLKLLVFENLHLLSNSAYIQRALRDTLDLLSEKGSITVITAQQSPALQTNLELGLRDRLRSGLTIRLRLPGPEAREELLGIAAKARGLSMDTASKRALAQKVVGPAPQLLRALALHEMATNSQGTANTQKSATDSTLEATAEATARIPIQPDFKTILALVARFFSLTQSALRSPARRKSLVYARGIVIYLARSLTQMSFAQIGQRLGKRDHTTIMNALKKTEQLLANDTQTQRILEKLHRILTSC